jgi:NADPH:quinone reductase-like Zn-dependent oxidoreductase
MNRAVDAQKIRPVVDSTRPFEALPDALNALGKGRHFGKIGIEFNP